MKLCKSLYPPVPMLYTKPKNIDEIIEHTCGRILDLIGIHSDNVPRWNGKLF